MKITFTGRQVDFPAAQMEKIEGQFAKLSKLLDGDGERGAHVVISHERHLHHAEVTINYHHHSLVGIATDADAFTALHAAVLKLEKQALKVREKWRDGFRTGEGKKSIASGALSSETDVDPAAV